MITTRNSCQFTVLTPLPPERFHKHLNSSQHVQLHQQFNIIIHMLQSEGATIVQGPAALTLPPQLYSSAPRQGSLSLPRELQHT